MFMGSGFEPDRFQRAMSSWESMRVDVMCGQYLDVVEQARGGGSVDRALRVARYKSAKYTVEGPLLLGAGLGAATPELMSGLSTFGLAVGEAFQLRDDVLGVFGDPEVTGKPAGDDLREGKRTVLVAYAAETADAEQTDLLNRHLGDAALDDAGVSALRDVITATGALDRVEQLIAERVETARDALAAAPMDDEARDVLGDLVTAAVDRQA